MRELIKGYLIVLLVTVFVLCGINIISILTMEIIGLRTNDLKPKILLVKQGYKGEPKINPMKYRVYDPKIFRDTADYEIYKGPMDYYAGEEVEFLGYSYTYRYRTIRNDTLPNLQKGERGIIRKFEDCLFGVALYKITFRRKNDTIFDTFYWDEFKPVEWK